MRKYRNLTKQQNDRLSKKFGHILKFTDDCTIDECKWVAITIFDHWLYETDSFEKITKATDLQKRKWDSKTFSFLHALVDLETPIGYRKIGKWSKKSLQFREYIGSKTIGDYIVSLFHKVYRPNFVFEQQRFDIQFGEYWTIYVIYNEVDLLEALFKLVASHDLFLLPVPSAGDLNQYAEIAQKLSDMDLKNAMYIYA